MDIRSYFGILWRRWMILVGCVAIGILSAIGVSALTQPEYEASTQLFVTATGGSSVMEAYQGNLFGQQRAEAYAKLAAGRQVAQRTVNALQIDMKADDLMSMVNAERVPGDTVLIAIKVRNPNPDMARDLANAVAQQTTQLVEELETSPRGGIPAATTVLVDQAVAPTSPVVPNWYRNMLFGLLGGLLIGLVAAITRDRLDRSVSSAAGTASTLDLRALGSVPPRPRSAAVVPVPATEPDVTEAFRAIRTNLLAARAGSDRSSHVIVVAAPTDGPATTTVAAGLATAMAESGRSVCLVDCNLRDQRSSNAFGVSELRGVADILDGSRRIDEKLVNINIAHLTFLPAGKLEKPTPGELLSREDLAELIKQLRSTFNFVLIDSPAVLPYSDTGVIAGWTDGVVLVARVNSTRMVDLLAAANKLRMAGNEPLGIVLTDEKRPYLASV
jgi:capsular exopolysaccharide synthesis family protein